MTLPPRKTRLRRRSAARAAAGPPFSTLARAGKLKRGPMKKRRRKPSETLRIYGTPERRAWVKSMGCAACGVYGYSENAHLLGNGGMSRKGDCTEIGPLCGPHMSYVGCHRLFDRHRSKFDARFPRFNPEEVAAMTERRWQLHLAELIP